MRRILCFGDSNTWGYDPATENRFDEDTRWTGVLQAALGADFTVIEEGLNGRTTVWNDPIEGYKNGHDYLVPCLETHRPLDLVVLMLGTNDLKRRFSLSAYDIAQGVAVLLRAISYSKAGRDGHAPRVLLMAPPPVAKLSNFAEMFEGSEAKSLLLGQHYRAVAKEYNAAFLDTASVIRSSDIDGIHFEPEEHAKLGRAVAHEVLALIGDW
jgi:lysophospholipase L1-like esterase